MATDAGYHQGVSTRRRAVRLTESNVFWSAAEAGVSAGFSFVSAFLVARLIGPAELGIGAAVVAMHVLLWVVVNALFADALVQSVTVDDAQASSAFWAAVAVGCLFGLLQVALGWPLASLLGDHRVVLMSVALAWPLPLVGAGGVIQGLHTRGRRYRALAGRAIIGQGLGTACGILLAFSGAGAWALVGQQLVTSAAGALSLILRSRWRPSLVLHVAPVRALLAIGVPLTISAWIQAGRYRLFALLIGGTAGATVLGQVHLAFRLVDTVRDLAMTALWRLVLPALSERQHDLPAMHAMLARVQALSGLVLFPVAGLMLAVAHPFVRLLLGPLWAPSSDAAAVLLLLACWVFAAFPAAVGVVARGRPEVALAANAASAALMLFGVLTWRPTTPTGAAWIWLAAQAALIPFTLVLTTRVLKLGPWRQSLTALPALLLAACATLAACTVPDLLGLPDSSALLIAARLAIGAAIYLPAAYLLLRRDVDDALLTVGARFSSCANNTTIS